MRHNVNSKDTYAIILAMHSQRLKFLRDLFEKNNIDALFTSSTYNINYLTGVSSFSEIEKEASLFITRKRCCLFTDARYMDEVNKIINKKEVRIGFTKSFILDINKIIKKEKIKSIGFEENLTHSEYKNLTENVDANFSLSDNLVEEIRIIKDQTELNSLRKACNLTDKTYSHVLKNIRIGITEKEIAYKIEAFIRKNGGELAFPSIVAFGKNSAVPHHKTGNTKLKINNIVLLDFGAKIDGYCADFTRTLFFGKAGKKFKKIYKTVLESQMKAIKHTSNLRAVASRIDSVSRSHITKSGYPPIPHSLGHGVGLQVHEKPSLSPKSSDYLDLNSVFTIEPGIYLSNFGGVRIEDTVVMTKNGIDVLTVSPKELVEISG